MLFFDDPSNRPSQIPVVITGCGEGSFIGRAAHLFALNAIGLFRVVSACPSRNETSCKWFQDNTGIPSFSGLEQALNVFGSKRDPRTALVICTPTAMHYSQIVKAISAGIKFIVCDKPLCVSMSEALAIKKLAEEAGVTIYVTFNHRYNGPVMQMREIVRQINGSGGARVLEVESFFDQDWLMSDPQIRQSKWRFESRFPALTDIGSHACDLSHFVLGDYVHTIENPLFQTHGKHGKPVFDYTYCDVGFSGGIRGFIRCGQAMPDHADDIGIALRTTKGAYHWRMASGPETLFFSENPQAEIDDPLAWRKYLRGHGSLFSPEVNAACELAPGGHIQGWPDMWRLLYAAVAGDINVKNGADASFFPAPMRLPAPTLDDAMLVQSFMHDLMQLAPKAEEATTA